MPMRMYCTMWMLVLRRISTKKTTAKVSTMMRMAYFTVRVVCWYWSTGMQRLTPNSDLLIK